MSMEEKNKKLTSECQILTMRILEEKNKMVEMINEANNIYEASQANFGGSITDSNSFKMKSSEEGDFLELIKPEYLN